LLSLLLADLGDDQVSLNHYLGGEFHVLNKIKGSKQVLGGEIRIQVQA